jgi:lysozyme
MSNDAFDRLLLLQELERDEGLRTKAYRDTVGKLTIGIGRNLDDVGLRDGEPQFLLSNDVDVVIGELDRDLAWWRSLSPNRQRVMINMCFNMGIGNNTRGLLSFKNTLANIRSGEYDNASKGMLSSRWAAQVGQRANRLAKIMRDG